MYLGILNIWSLGIMVKNSENSFNWVYNSQEQQKK